MKKRDKRKSWMGLVLIIALAFAISLVLTQVAAAVCTVTCSTGMSQTSDCDNDGFTDYQECYGITLKDRVSQATTCVCGLAGCCGSSPLNPDNRASRLDPNSQDLFAILMPAQPTNFPANFNTFEFVSNSTAAGGLGITVHPISDNQANRDDIIAANDRWLLGPSGFYGQKAVRIREDLNACSTYPCNANVCACDLGLSYRGNVKAGQDNATIYTLRIQKEIILAYGSLAAAPAGFYEKYMKHTIAHEMGHMLSLTLSSQNNYHWAAKSNYTLDQYVYRKGTTWVLGTKYSTIDQSNLHMIP